MTRRLDRQNKKTYTKRRKLKPYILLGLEGNNKTEKKYFEYLAKKCDKYQIIFAKGNDTDLDSIVKHIVESIKDYGLGSNDKCFCVVDLDNLEQKAIKFETFQKTKQGKNIKLIISNPTFEVWLLLHFKPYTKFLADGNAVIKELKEFLSNYEKDIKEKDLSILYEKLENAIKNAETLEKINSEKNRLIDKNPSTDVHKIVKLLECKK